jgi:hypothetical protein
MERQGDPREGLGDPRGRLGDPRGLLGHPRGRLGHPRRRLGHPRGLLGYCRGVWATPKKVYIDLVDLSDMVKIVKTKMVQPNCIIFCSTSAPMFKGLN